MQNSYLHGRYRNENSEIIKIPKTFLDKERSFRYYIISKIFDGGEYMFSKVYVEITNICNMSCSFCHGHKRPPRRMTREEFSLILNKLQGHTKYIYYHLMGEPLTHPCLTEFIKMAGECGYKSIITTNGTLLDKRGEGLIESGIHKINVSFYSLFASKKKALFLFFLPFDILYNHGLF